MKPACLLQTSRATGVKPVVVRAVPKSASVRVVDLKAGLAAAIALLPVAPVFAEEVTGTTTTDATTATVDQAVDVISNSLKAAGGFVKTGLSAAEEAIKILKEGYDIAAPVVKQGVDIVAPVVSKAVSAAADIVLPAIKDALPSITNVTKDAVEGTGLDVKTLSNATSVVVKTAGQAVDVATPFLSKVAGVVSQSDPTTLAEFAAGAVVLLYLTPSLLGLLKGSFRGYAGEVSAASAQDAAANEGNMVLVDIRTQKEKETSGVPDVPSSASGKLIDVEFAVLDDRKLRSSVRDARAIESQVTALEIGALKRVSKGTKIVLLDRYGTVARDVAKELGRKGYSRVFIIAGGFDGRGGWISSKLQIKPAASIYIAPPAPVVPKSSTVRSPPARSTTVKSVTTSKAATVRKALPPPKASS